VRATVDKGAVRATVAAKVDEIRQRLSSVGAVVGRPSPRAAFAWSGGKDSQVLQIVCEAAGIVECGLIICCLEYPEFLGWATDNMPHGLTVLRSPAEPKPWNLEWLAAHPHMLFPADSDEAMKWYAAIQHKGQRRLCAGGRFDVLVMGRRREEGNFLSREGPDYYVDRQNKATGPFVRWSPLSDWSQELVFAVLATYDVPLAPFYRWPRGFQCGSGAWPARRSVDDPRFVPAGERRHDVGWAEVYAIDAGVVEHAAEQIDEARAWLDRGKPMLEYVAKERV